MRKLLRRFLFDAEILKLMGLVIMVKPLGLVTQMLTAQYFGAGPRYDAYSLALFIVSFSATVLGNVFTSAAVPFIIKLRSTLDPRELYGFQNGVMLLFVVPAVGISVVMLLVPGVIVDIIGPGLPAETWGYSTQMVRMMAIPGLFLLIGMMGKAVLNLNRSYQLPASLPILNAVIMLLTVVLTHEQLGIWSLVLGFSVSYLVQGACQWWWTVRLHYASNVKPHFPPGTKRVLWSLSWMLLVSQAVILVIQFIDRMFAASLAPGNISSISYANTIVLFGVQIFTLSQVTVMFTRISELISDDDISGCSRYIGDNIGRLSRLAIPAALAISVASGEIVRVLFQRGEFSAEDAERTSVALAIYILGMLGFIVNHLSARVYHALQRMKERIWLALQFLVTKVALNALLVGSYGVAGLAVSSTVAIYSHVILSLWILHRYRIGLQVGSWSRILIRNHIIALFTYMLYLASGIKKNAVTWSIYETVQGDIAIAILKVGFIFTVYFALFFIWRFLNKRTT